MRNSPESEAGERPTPEPDERPAHAEHEELRAELARVEDRYKRALADLDNYRKRATREIERRVAEAKQSVIVDWLQVVDSVERAMRLEPGGPCFDGQRAVLDQIEAVLAREGVHRIGAAGDPFDPERHEATAVQDSADVPDRTVLAVERSGFALGDQVIRPAQVVVARTPEHAR
jgi:molecular chaperone GrpE